MRKTDTPDHNMDNLDVPDLPTRSKLLNSLFR